MNPQVIKSDGVREYLTKEHCYILELVNRPLDDSLSIARARVEPGVTTAWHSLDGIDERYLIISGKGLMELGDLPSQSVESGDLVIIPAGCPQRITNTGNVDLIFYCICTPGFSHDKYKSLE